MNWLVVASVLILIYILWFGYLISRKRYTRSLLFLALAQLPYLLINLVAPFRGAFDSSYAGYSMGWIVLPKGFVVTLVIGFIVIACLFIASRALQGRMNGIWIFSFLLNLALLILIAIPVLVEIIVDISQFTVELGEYLKISGIWVALLIFIVFVIPTLYACIYSGSKSFKKQLNLN